MINIHLQLLTMLRHVARLFLQSLLLSRLDMRRHLGSEFNEIREIKGSLINPVCYWEGCAPAQLLQLLLSRLDMRMNLGSDLN